MQPETANIFLDSFIQHRDSFGVDIVINGETVQATVNESQFGRELLDGGFADESDIDVKFVISELCNLPDLGDTVTYRDRKFKVSNTGYQPGALVGEITCRPAKRT